MSAWTHRLHAACVRFLHRVCICLRRYLDSPPTVRCGVACKVVEAISTTDRARLCHRWQTGRIGVHQPQLSTMTRSDPRRSVTRYVTWLHRLCCASQLESWNDPSSASCRCTGRPFVEAKADPAHPFRTTADRWTKRLKYTLISLPIWASISLLSVAKFSQEV